MLHVYSWLNELIRNNGQIEQNFIVILYVVTKNECQNNFNNAIIAGWLKVKLLESLAPDCISFYQTAVFTDCGPWLKWFIHHWWLMCSLQVSSATQPCLSYPPMSSCRLEQIATLMRKKLLSPISMFSFFTSWLVWLDLKGEEMFFYVLYKNLGWAPWNS